MNDDKTLHLLTINVNCFPIAIIDSSTLSPGDGFKIIYDLERLIEYGRKFVLILINGHTPKTQSHEDDRERIVWIKKNKNRLSSVCKGIVTIFFGTDGLPLIEKQAASISAAIGIPFTVVNSREEAFKYATIILNS